MSTALCRAVEPVSRNRLSPVKIYPPGTPPGNIFRNLLCAYTCRLCVCTIASIDYLWYKHCNSFVNLHVSTHARDMDNKHNKCMQLYVDCIAFIHYTNTNYSHYVIRFFT